MPQTDKQLILNKRKSFNKNELIFIWETFLYVWTFELMK